LDAPELEQARNTSVQVISGASVQSLDLAGLQITQAREIVRAILSLDQQSAVLVNGQPVRDDYRLVCGDTLEFVHHAGEKG
jgi:pSer/pThr/pTyr-binding forkhead associated (FHA) protein